MNYPEKTSSPEENESDDTMWGKTPVSSCRLAHHLQAVSSICESLQTINALNLMSVQQRELRPLQDDDDVTRGCACDWVELQLGMVSDSSSETPVFSGVSVRDESRVVRGAASSVPVPESLLLSRELPHDSDDHSNKLRSTPATGAHMSDADVTLSESLETFDLLSLCANLTRAPRFDSRAT